MLCGEESGALGTGTAAVPAAGGTDPADGAAGREKGRYYLRYFAALLLFSSNGIAASRIGLASDQIVLLRALLGGTFLTALFFLTGHKPTALRHRRDLFFIALSGLSMAADWLLLFEAYTRIGVSLSMLINYCGPAAVVALSPVIFRERVTGRKLIALAAALLGAVLVSGAAVEAGAGLLGILFAALSAAGYAGMVIFNKLAREIKGVETAMLQLLFALAGIAVFVGVRRGLLLEIAAGDWPAILWLGLLNTGVSCCFYFSAMGRLPAQTVAICGYLEPLASVLLAAALLGETMRPLQILGAALILGGAVFGELGSRKNGRRPPR